MDNLLILDDEIPNLRLFSEILEHEGYHVILKENYDDFKAYLKSDNVVDLILLDYMLPGKNGLMILHELKKDPAYKKIPVIIITAFDDSDINLKALKIGAEDFITKPINHKILLVRVNSILNSLKYISFKDEYSDRLEKEVNSKTHEISEMLENQKNISNEIIDRLAMTAEYRDTDTGHHIIRMAEYSETIALAARFNPEQAEIIKQSAKMHDLGKIAIPDSILLKPSKLDSDEWVIMKSHTTVGAEILKGSKNKNIQVAEVIALTHHEKWDGSGYPHGLKGENIPLEGRIVAIADVFDALTSARPYKKPFSFEESLDIIRKDSGTHFDPHLVQLFFEGIESIRSVYQLWSNKGE